MANIPYTLDEKQILKEYNTTKKGLSSTQAKERLQKYGKNELAKVKKASKLKMFFKQFCDFMIIILLVAAIVCAVVAVVEKEYSDLIDVGVILAIVIINAIIGFVQENKAENALSQLKKISQPVATVMRYGKIIDINATDVVVGDILVLEAGDVCCADVYLLESASLKCDESSLTGESSEVEKFVSSGLPKDTAVGDRTNIVHSSSVVTYGRGLGVVVATAMDTELGKIATMLQEDEKETTPIQEKLNSLGKIITIGVLAIAVIIFIINIVIKTEPDYIQALMVSIAIAVAAIPESLPAVITIIMALGVSNMSKKKAIIRKLHAVETLGSCEIICTDKTGTLTQNKMQVEGAYFNSQLYELKKIKQMPQNQHFLNCMQLCNDCYFEESKFKGDPTEVALVEFAFNLGFDKTKTELEFPRIAELPFDSNRKMMTTFNKVNNKVYAYTKGAPDVLLQHCSKILIDGKIVNLTKTIKTKIEQENENMCAKGWRVLALSYKPHSSKTFMLEDENDLVFLGLLGMRDPPRDSTLQAVKTCRSAGMVPIMITGDHAATAKQIAKEVGIWNENSIILTGKELDALSDEEYLKIIKQVSVYARVSPENKVRIVEMWKKLGKVVAMTGDGVNDAPSIKRADIGIGMGISGTEVTKEVADMVLTDDNFATIIIAVKEGRKIYTNIKKTIQYLFGTNIVEVLSLLIATIFFPQLVFLLPLQILYVNLVSDSLPAIALSVEHSEKDIMKQPPRSKKEGIFTSNMVGAMIVQAIFQTLSIVLVFDFAYNLTGSNAEATTMAFVCLALSQLIHVFNVRTEHSIFVSNPFRNWILWFAVLLGGGLSILIVSVPAIANVFGLVPLSAIEWLVIFAVSFAIIPVMEIYKLIYHAIKKHKNKKSK